MNRKNIARKIARSYIKRSKARWKEEGWERENPVEIAKSYVDREGYGFHFSELGPDSHGGFKLGLNPMTDFDTPAGVYAYTSDKMNWEHHISPFSTGQAFGDGRDWIYIVSYPSSPSVIHLDKSGNARWSDRDMQKFMSLFYEKHTRYCQKVLSAKGEEVSSFEDFFHSNWVRRKMEEAKHQTPFVRMWNVMDKMMKTRGGTSKWNKVLRDIGIQGIVDHGSQTIHDAEAFQFVMLKGNLVEVEDIVPNLRNWWDGKESRQVQKGVEEALQSSPIRQTLSSHPNLSFSDIRSVIDNSTRSSFYPDSPDEIEEIDEEVRQQAIDVIDLLEANPDIYGFLEEAKQGGLPLEGIRVNKDPSSSRFVRIEEESIEGIDFSEWGETVETYSCTFSYCSFEAKESTDSVPQYKNTSSLSYCTLYASKSDLEHAIDDVRGSMANTDTFSDEELIDIFDKTVAVEYGNTAYSNVSEEYAVIIANNFLHSVFKISSPGLDNKTSITNLCTLHID
jgi:hypothetical protein